MEVQDDLIQRMQEEVSRTKGWMVFWGIVSIISGALSAISIVGIVVAWLPIWMGIVLLQAGGRGGDFASSKDFQHLSQMLSKLRLYFLIGGITIIVTLVVSIVFTLAGGLAILRDLGGYF